MKSKKLEVTPEVAKAYYYYRELVSMLKSMVVAEDEFSERCGFMKNNSTVEKAKQLLLELDEI